jgi:hypothetical protein
MEVTLTNFSIFEYFYRDASNYKAWGSVLLKGEVTRAQVVKIRSRFDVEELFIAEQLGLPPLYAELWAFSNGPTCSDHVWHTFHDIRVAGSDLDLGAVFGTVENFISRVESLSHWNGKLSPHWEL